MHKGRINVLDSDLGGARFEVALPVSRIGTGAAAAGAAAGLDRAAARRRPRGAALHRHQSRRRPNRPRFRPSPDGRASSSSRTTPT